MIIHFEHVIGENFGSWKEIEYSFPKAGKHLVTGRNGSGKSTFFEFPSWILYGKNTKDLKVDEVVNWHSDENCWGHLVFTKGNKKWRVERYRNHPQEGNCLKLFDITVGEDEKTKTKGSATQEEIEKIIGLNHTAFICSILLSQAKMSTFLEIDGTERHNLFDSIMRLHLLKPYEKKVKDRYKVLKTELSRLDKESYTLQEKLSQLDGIIKDYQSNIDEKKKKLTADRDVLQNQLDNIKNTPIEELKNFYNLIDKLNETKSQVSTEVELILEEMQALDSRIESLEKSECPECGQAVEAHDSLAECSTQKGDLQSEYDEVVAENSRLEKEAAGIQESLNKIAKTALKDFVKEENGSFKIKLSYEDVIRFESRIEALNAQITLANKNIEEAGKNMDLDKLKNIHTNNSAELKKLKAEEEVLSEEKRRFNDFWVKVFDKKDDIYIKKVLMASLVSQTNNYVNRRIDQFPFDEVKSAEFTDTLGFEVSIVTKDGGVERTVPYKALSGGEKRKLNVCVNLALNDLIYLQYAKIAETFMDEISTGLDDESNIVLAEMLEELSQEKPVHVISHANVFNNQFDDAVRVERYEDNGHLFSRFQKMS